MICGSVLLNLCYAGLAVIAVLALLWYQDDRAKKRQAEERKQAREKTRAVTERMKQVRKMDREEEKKAEKMPRSQNG